MIPFNRVMIETSMDRTYKALQSTVGIAKLSASTGQGNLYGEIKYPKFDPPVEFNAHTTLNPSEEKLSELGWQKDDVELVIRVPHIILRGVGLAEETGELNFNSDARVVVGGRSYEICKIHMKEPFLLNIPALVWIGGRNPNGHA
jgi:hypothetical protein